MVLSLVLSCANHSVAQNAPSNHNDQSEEVTELKKNFKKMGHQLRGYIRCFTSEAGCSRARKAAVTAAIIGFLFLVGRQERRAREEHMGLQAQFEREREEAVRRAARQAGGIESSGAKAKGRKGRKARRATALYLEEKPSPGWGKQEVP